MTKIGFINDLHGKVTNPISRTDDYMSAILKKVEYVLKNNDVVVFTGDILDTCVTGILFVNKFLDLVTMYESTGVQILILAGNHDLIGRNYQSWKDTSLGTICMGRGWLMNNNRTYTGENYNIVPLSFTDEGSPALPEEAIKEGKVNILVGHAYYNLGNYEDKWNIPKDCAILKGFDYCILGHDHMVYPPELVQGCQLLRCGSISRKDISDKDRIPKYTRIMITTGVKADYISVPHSKPEDTFKQDDVARDLAKHKANVNAIIDKLRVSVTGDTTISKVLEEMKVPKRYINLIREVLYG